MHFTGMVPLDQSPGLVLRLLVIGIFGVTNVSMQNRVLPLNAPSDNFDSGYPNTGTFDVAWEITVESDHQILLQFLDFSLNETISCTVDVLQLYNGNRIDNELVDCFCWDDVTNLTTTAYISSSNQFYIPLITKEGYSRKGFRAQYTTVNLQHTTSSGEIMSPGYPNTGPLDEAWRIKVNEGDNIRLELLDFALYESDPCNHDYFELYDGACNRYQMLRRWCWNSFDKLTQTVYISSGNIFYLRLRTRHAFSRRGFKASYSSIPNNSTDVTEMGSLHCGSSKSTTPSANKAALSTIMRMDKTIKTSTTTESGNTGETGIQPAALSTIMRTDKTIKTLTTTESGNTGETGIQPAALSTIMKTEKTIKTSTTTESGNTGIQPGIVVGILAVIVLAICIIGIIVWKFKIKKNASVGQGAPSNVERSIGMYEDVNHHKHAVNDDSYETPNERKSTSNVHPDVYSSHVQQHSVYSKEIIRQTSERQANTPDGTYEKPDFSVYSYADPNELRFNKA